jgi:hypothetical protein
MIGIIKLIRFLYTLVDPAANALWRAPLEWKWLATNVLAFMWCVAFGITVGEYITIGYSIMGHVALITMCFGTYWFMRRAERAWG